MLVKKDSLAEIRKELVKIAGKENVFTDNTTSALYCYDSSLTKARPEAVINITSRSHLQPIVKLLYTHNIPFVARGAGTNLSGGTVSLKGGAILNLAPLNKILKIDTKNGYAVVEAGVVNEKLQDELDSLGYFYAPDPASQKACTIGGNVGENAGGPRCLKYGVTLNNVISAKIITPEGDAVNWSVSDNGPDLLGLFIGSEGTLGIASEIKLKIIKKPPHIKTVLVGFKSLEDAIKSVLEIIAGGVVPSTIEALDKVTIEASEKHTKTGYPADCAAVLLIEFDGTEKTIADEEETTRKICKANNVSHWIAASDEDARIKLWQGRKSAFAAMARLAPNVSVEDGVVPRPKLPEALKNIRLTLSKYNLKAGLVFHAGDGNMHPNIILDERNYFETSRVKKAGREMLKNCVELGGSISGEHGIGVEKRFAMNWLYTEQELEVFRKIKKVFDPKNLSNPDKIIPINKSQEENKDFIRPDFFEISQNAKDITAKISAAYKTKTKTLITGFKTKTNTPAQSNTQILDTTKMCQILNVDRENYTITIETGIKLSDLHRKLEKQNLYLNLPDNEGSLGGLLATGSYTTVRDVILAMTILLPNGEVASFGTNTVKNVAGYDVIRLMLGSKGAYAVILNVTLQLSTSKTNANGAPQKTQTFQPSKYHIGLKKALDKYNLFNSHIFEKLL